MTKFQVRISASLIYPHLCDTGASIPDLDKIIKISKLFGVSTDYLLKDELEEVAYAETIPETTDGRRSIFLDKANEYMDTVRSLTRKITCAVVLFILSPVCLIMLGGFADCLGVITDDMAGGIGTVILLTVIAVGVAIVIPCGIKLEKYEYLEKESISLQYGVQGIVEKKKNEYGDAYRRSIVTGVILCISGVIPLFLAAAFSMPEFVLILCIDLLLILIAGGVYLFLPSVCIYESCQKLLQEGDYTEERKRIRAKISFFPGAYWLIVVAIYLGVSFYFDNAWNRTWIVWPVAGLLFAAIYAILEGIAKNKK